MARSLDEFESIFQASVRPKIVLHDEPMKRMLTVVGDDTKGESAVQLTAGLARRFGSDVLVLKATNQARYVDQLLEAAESVERADLQLGDPLSHYDLAQQILQRIDEQKPHLVILPCPFMEPEMASSTQSLGTVVDIVMHTIELPLLLVTNTIDRAETVFDNILAYIPQDNIEHPQELETMFTVAAPGGQIELLHVLDQRVASILEQALKAAPEVDTHVASQSLLRSMETQMRHLLESAAGAVDHKGLRSKWSVEIGYPIRRVVEKIAAEEHSLLLIKADRRHHKQGIIDRVVYNLALLIDRVPLLIV